MIAHTYPLNHSDNTNKEGEAGMTYHNYADHHITERAEPPKNECQTLRLPKSLCGCPDCCESRYPADLVESDGGEA